MKIYICLFFCFVGLTAFGQKESDENGRPIGSKPTSFVSSIENDVYLRKNSEQSASGKIAVEYSLPAGNTSGKLILFHPKLDEQLKSVSLNGNNGVVLIDLKELGYAGFNAGLYLNNDTFIQSQSFY